jgi:hypothetical protein
VLRKNLLFEKLRNQILRPRASINTSEPNLTKNPCKLSNLFSSSLPFPSLPFPSFPFPIKKKMTLLADFETLCTSPTSWMMKKEVVALTLLFYMYFSKPLFRFIRNTFSINKDGRFNQIFPTIHKFIANSR